MDERTKEDLGLSKEYVCKHCGTSSKDALPCDQTVQCSGCLRVDWAEDEGLFVEDKS